MRAILVCVDYADILAITLPYNRHHFTEVMVVTTPSDIETISVAEKYGAEVYATESFYTNGAIFNKWLSLEEGLDKFGRHGLLVIMDADILWPKEIQHEEYKHGYLYSPYRRIYRSCDTLGETPAEENWKLCRQFTDREWAGYSQIFYADDPALPSPPWHQVDWIHAGGADSFFQRLWPDKMKLRPTWEVLHLGQPGENWCGRVTKRVDGTTPEESTERKLQLTRILHLRRLGGGFAHERIKPVHGS